MEMKNTEPILWFCVSISAKVTNLKTDSEDTTEVTFEFYTDDRILTWDCRRYSDVNDVKGIKNTTTNLEPVLEDC